jgi:hypothetical protein
LAKALDSSLCFERATTVKAYRGLNCAFASVNDDLAFDLSLVNATLPPYVWDLRVCASVIFVSTASSAPLVVAHESLENQSPLPPHVGSALVQEITHEGLFRAGTVDLRKDLKSVAAMALDPLWDAPGGWREKALVEHNMVINERKHLSR